MRRLRGVGAIVVLVSVLVGISPAVSAAPASHLSVRVDNASIPWIFPDGLASFCSEVPEGVQINPDANGSSRVKNAAQVDKPGGAKQVTISDLVRGTAHDGAGTRYTFVYENNASYDFDGAVVAVAMKDTFHLKGGAVNFVVGFNWRWQYAASSFNVVAGPEDIGVDPFFFATSDGVQEDPNIVPGSWQRLSTRGDPANCDPL